MIKPTTGLFTGPGSQPGDEDGAQLDYMQMPSGMMTFSAADLPEPEDIEGLNQGKALLDEVLQLLNSYDGDRPGNLIELGELDEANLKLIDQVLGEGEVAIVAGDSIQAQEAVLAGVWRVRVTGTDGRLQRDLIEVASFPDTALTTAFQDAQPEIRIPESFGPNIFNTPALLAEINDNIPKVAEGRAPHAINLSLLPHTEEDLGCLNDLLGRGGMTILSRGYGNCRITSTATLNVWWVQFYNSQDTLILNSIEVTSLPEVAKAASEDIADSAERLSEILEVYE